MIYMLSTKIKLQNQPRYPATPLGTKKTYINQRLTATMPSGVKNPNPATPLTPEMTQKQAKKEEKR